MATIPTIDKASKHPEPVEIDSPIYKFSNSLIDFDEGIGYYNKDMLSETGYMIPKIHDGIIPMVRFKLPD